MNCISQLLAMSAGREFTAWCGDQQQRALYRAPSQSDVAIRSHLSTAIPMSTSTEKYTELIERIERALVLLAYFIQLDGDAHVAMYEKFEAELAELRRRESTKERALRLLSSYSRSGQVKAISSKNLTLSSNGGPLPYLGL
jgi:hypothetical protein